MSLREQDLNPTVMLEPKKVNITINNIPLQVDENLTVLLAARQAGFDIPTLCYLKDINEIAACRLCIVEAEINGRPMRNLPASCALKVEEGMSIKTNTTKIRKAVKQNLELILANHNRDCLTCNRNGSCELQTLCEQRGIDVVSITGEKREAKIDNLSWSIVRDTSKCILCGRCVNTCKKVQGLGVLDFVGRGFHSEVAPAFDYSMRDVNCIYCGQCIEACPVAALREKSNIEQVFDAIDDPTIHVVVQAAPSVRAAIGEEFGVKMGTPTTGKMTAALRRLGFDRVFDTNFSADLTIMEEANELISRVLNGGKLPLITSCSPGWVKFCEMYYPDFLENLSTCKSPQQMMGAMIKTYYAKQHNIDPKSILSVSVMPCTSKKSEANRPEMQVDGLRDVDVSLTTRELADMIRAAGIDFNNLPDEKPDPLMGDYTGAGVIFGATGGVMEAALRTAADILTGTDVQDIEYHAVRDLRGVKEASVVLPINGVDTEIKIAVAHTVLHASKVLDAVRNGEKEYHFIEVMACPGGCVHGGGQPIVSAKDRLTLNPHALRAQALYTEDESQMLRKSHHNPEIIKIYKDFLGEPNSELSHKLLHTHYYQRGYYPQDKKEEVLER